MKEELIELSDSEMPNQIDPKVEEEGTPSRLNSTAKRHIELQAMNSEFELTDPDRKDEFRALIREMGLEWEKVDGSVILNILRAPLINPL